MNINKSYIKIILVVVLVSTIFVFYEKGNLDGSLKVKKIYSAPIIGAVESFANSDEINSIKDNKIVIDDTDFEVANKECINLKKNSETISTADYLSEEKVSGTFVLESSYDTINIWEDHREQM